MATAKYETILVEKEDGITWVKFNRPEKRNAMSPELHFDMDAALTELDSDPDTQVLVLTGEGQAFSAGMDLKRFFRDIDDSPAERTRARKASRHWSWDRLRGFNKPTIAMVNGYCFGAAFTCVCAMDFAIAAEDATFGLSEVNWGILPGGLVSKVMVDAVSFRDAMYYACTGDAFDGKKAAEMRLINFAVPKENLREETVKLAKKLMQKSPEVLRAIKHAIRAVRTMDVEQAYDYLEAKAGEVRFRDKEDSRTQGMKQFLDDKSYRPGLGPFKRKGS